MKFLCAYNLHTVGNVTGIQCRCDNGGNKGAIKDTHQVSFGQVLKLWRVKGGCFPKAVAVTGRFGWLGMLPISGTFRSPAEKVDGFTDTALNVHF